MAMKSVELTEREKELLEQVDFSPWSGIHDANAARTSGEAACALMKSLIKREAIPKARVRWFTNADHNVGGHGKSRKQAFERKGVCGEDIFRNPHFLKYLRYFLYGPHLPASAIQGFEGEVASCGRVSSSDVIPLGNYAKQLARSHCLDPATAADEFYKLALECGLDVAIAGSIRRAVKRIRTSR